MKKLVIIAVTVLFVAVLVFVGISRFIEFRHPALLSKAPDHGTSFVVETAFPKTEGNVLDLAELQKAIRSRAAKLPVRIFWEPISTTRVRVSIPTLSRGNPDLVRNYLFRNGVLEFCMVHPNSEQILAGKAVPDPAYKVETYKGDRDGKPFEEQLLVKKKADLPGSMVADAHPHFDKQGWGVSLQFNSVGTELFGQLTSANVGKRFAIVLDGVIQSAPVIRDAIWGGSATISGSFKEEQARLLAWTLESPLPASVTVVEWNDF